MKKHKDSKYNAVICKLTNVRPHPNADRLQIANAMGYGVIVGLDAKEGDIGVLFPEGGQLSNEMGLANNLYRKHPVTGEKMGGYFDSNLRVKTCKLRGQISEAFFTSLDCFDWLGKNIKFKVGQEFNKLGNQLICQKYYTKATIRAMKRAERRYKKPWYIPKFMVKYHKKYFVNKKVKDPCPTFAKHFDTKKLRMVQHMIEPGFTVIVSSKEHGSSGRTANVPYDDRSLFQKMLLRPIPYQYVTGTRNVVKNPKNFEKSVDDGYYAGSTFRQEIHAQIKEKGLYKDEIIYYEILGFENNTTPIMPNHKLNWKDFEKEGFTKQEFQELVDKYGETVTYHYGNSPGEHSIKIYRIVQNGVDLTDTAMRARAAELGFDCVTKLAVVDSGEDLMAISKDLSEQPDSEEQLREGVCLRLEKEGKLYRILKYKSNSFCVLEGIRRNDVDYVDREEIS